MSFTYRLPLGYEQTPIPTDAERKKECRHLINLLEQHKDAIEKIDGLVGYGIGIAVDNWCKIRIKLKFSYKMTDLQMYDSATVIAELPGMSYGIIEGKRENKPSGGAPTPASRSEGARIATSTRPPAGAKQ